MKTIIFWYLIGGLATQLIRFGLLLFLVHTRKTTFNFKTIKGSILYLLIEVIGTTFVWPALVALYIAYFVSKKVRRFIAKDIADAADSMYDLE